jgi:hypothetical protein
MSRREILYGVASMPVIAFVAKEMKLWFKVLLTNGKVLLALKLHSMTCTSLPLAMN